jgi:hypothetical protein
MCVGSGFRRAVAHGTGNEMKFKSLKSAIRKLKWSGLPPDRIIAYSTLVMTLATLVLVGVTWYYARLTNRLVQLQIEPSVEAGLNEPFVGSTVFALRNTGAEPVENAIVNIRCFLFRGPNDQQPAVVFTGLPSDEKRSWWKVRILRSGEVVTKDSVESLTGCLVNKANMEKFEREKVEQQTKSPNVQPFTLGSIVVFDVSYQRQVDRKRYRVSRPAWLYKDGKTGQPILSIPVISSEFKPLFDELISGRVNRR